MANAHTLTPNQSTPKSIQAFSPGHWRGWLRLLIEAMVSALVIALLLAMSVLMGAAVARAEAPKINSGAQRYQPGHPVQQAPDGTALLFRTEAGLISAPLQSSSVSLQVTGHIVRARVSQTYTNSSKTWINGVYQFPLPEDSAVDTLRMRIGQRVLVGEIKPRETAKRQFEKAKANGQRASLIEQQRPNVFSAAVANIAPQSDITIEIEYQQVLALTPAGWALRFPTVVAPRYSPRSQPEQQVQRSSAKVLPVAWTPETNDAAHREPAQSGESGNALPVQPTLLQQDSTQNRLTIEVIIDAGMPVTIPTSVTHNVTVNTVAATETNPLPGYRVMLASETLADRDFELNWAPQPEAEPQASLQWEQHGEDWFALLSVAPPAVDAETVINKPREIILVLDTSGSMHGTLDDAKTAVAYALQQLEPTDRFNLIEFNSTHSSLFAQSRRATPNNLQVASRFLRSLRSNGGTEMRGALLTALKTSVPADTFSQVVFITDGAVDNEAGLFNLIETMLGERKLFTVGIGSAPNAFFMRKAATAGRGSFTLINQGSEVTTRMRDLFKRLSSPMLTNLRLRDKQGEVIDTGMAIRDLYAGEPIIHVFKVPFKIDEVTVEGEQNEFAWQQPVPAKQVEQRGIARLWARGQLDTLADEIRRFAYDGRDPNPLREQATLVAMNHHLVSAYTSLVTVDATPVRPASEAATDALIPRQLPKGWNANAFKRASTMSGTLAQTSNGLWWQLMSGGLLLAFAVFAIAGFLYRAQSLLNHD